MLVVKQVRALPRIVHVLAIAGFVNRAGTMVVPFLVLYLVRHEHLSEGSAGLVVASYGVGAVVVAPIAGRLVDAWGALSILRASMLAASGLCALMPFVHGFVPWLATAFTFACAAESLWAATQTLVGASVGPDQRKLAFALNRLAGNLGLSVGPAIGGVLIAYDMATTLFAVDAATSFAAAILLLRVRAPARVAPTTDTSGAATSRGIDARMIYFLVALLPVTLVFYQSASTLAVFTVSIAGHSGSFYGLLFTINTVLVATIELSLNSATSGWTHARTLAVGALCIGLGYGVLAVDGGHAAIVGSVVVWTFGEMLMLPASTAYVADIAPSGRAGAYMGWFGMLVGLASGVGPLLGMLVLEHFGARALWLGALGMGVASALAFTRAHRQQAVS